MNPYSTPVLWMTSPNSTSNHGRRSKNLKIEENLDIKTNWNTWNSISKNATIEEDVNSGQLHPVTWDKTINIKTKKIIYEYIVQSTNLYSRCNVMVIKKKNRG